MKFLTPKEVCERTSLSRSSLDRLVKAGEFPSPINLTERRIAFPEEAVAGWMEQRLAQPFAYNTNRVFSERAQ